MKALPGLSRILRSRPAIKLGDVWDALEKAGIRHEGAGLGTAFFYAPGELRLPNRHFYDHGTPSAALLLQLASWGVHPVASGKYQSPRPDPRFTATASPLLMADWSDPGATVLTGVSAIAFYLGGWTPHVWTPGQIAAQTVAPMLPIWVYNPNHPGSANGTADANTALIALRNSAIPVGVRVAVDMEGSVDVPYLSAFRGTIANAGYWTTIYGEASTIFGNWSIASGPGGGWWVADWTGTPHLYNHLGVWATQFCNGSSLCPTAWDQSVVSVMDHLWPHIPASFTLTAKAQDSETLTIASKTATFVVG